ncbi:MAG TPA: 4-hydroxy-tetrahydrodipicolinate reductase [Saprospiraceae bacterium]|nr:4-hydroxy-tetrahydrodipicolinate reductase [Saprospiraceae bacterium]
MQKEVTIGIIGMGRMGQAIATQIESVQHLHFHPFERLSTDRLASLKTCDVAIEFTTPEAAPEVIRTCLKAGIPTVSGTTGWHEYHLEEILTFCRNTGGKLLYATNFSIGMNVVFALNEKLAGLLEAYPEFKPAVQEIHHIHKKDMPSGTAYTLIEQIMKEQPKYERINLNHAQDDQSNAIPVTAIREGEVKGIHEVTWDSGLEKITLTHEARDRGIFAAGAISAARWLISQPKGIYTMKDFIQG